MQKKRSWREKLADNKGLPKTGPITGKMSRRWGSGTMVVPAPVEVDELMQKVPRGKLATIDEIRNCLARKHGVTLACPITTGIFAWIAAHAADEAERAGSKAVTPYWRTLKSNGELNPKYPRGVRNLASRLRAEGHTVVKKGDHYRIPLFREALVQFPSPGRAVVVQPA